MRVENQSQLGHRAGLQPAHVQLINAFQFESWGKFRLWLVLGLLFIAAGLVTFENPLLAPAALTLLLGIALSLARLYSSSDFEIGSTQKPCSPRMMASHEVNP